MERFSFAPEAAFVPRGDLLDRVTVAPLTPSILEGSPVQAAIFRVERGDAVAHLERLTGTTVDREAVIAYRTRRQLPDLGSRCASAEALAKHAYGVVALPELGDE